MAEVVSNTFRAIVNAISDTLQHVMEAIEGALKVLREAVQKLVEMIEAGVRLITAGLAAVAGFLGKLFRDAVEFFRELGQKVWGALQEFAEAVAKALRCVLYWMSWVVAQLCALAIEVVKAVISSFSTSVSGDWGEFFVTIEAFSVSISVGLSIVEVDWNGLVLWSANTSVLLSFGRKFGFTLIIAMIPVFAQFVLINESSDVTAVSSSSLSSHEKRVWSPLLNESLIEEWLTWYTYAVLACLTAVQAALPPLALGAEYAISVNPASQGLFIQLMDILVCAYLLALTSPIPSLVACASVVDLGRLGTFLTLLAVINLAYLITCALAMSSRVGERISVEDLVREAGDIYRYVAITLALEVFETVLAVCFPQYLAAFLMEFFDFLLERALVRFGLERLAGVGTMALSVVKDSRVRGLVLEFLIAMLVITTATALGVWAVTPAKISEAKSDLPSVSAEASYDESSRILRIWINVSDDDLVKKVAVELVKSHPNTTADYDHILFENCEKTIYDMIVVERTADGKYEVSVVNEEVEGKRAKAMISPGQTAQLKLVASHLGVKLSGIVEVSVSSDSRRVEVKAELTVEGELSDIADSIIAWAWDERNQAAVRAFIFDCPARELSIEGVPPHTNSTREFGKPMPPLGGYLKLVHILGEEYVVGDYLVVRVASNFSTVCFTPLIACCLSSPGGFVACLAMDASRWPELDGLESTIIADNRTVGSIRFECLWWYEDFRWWLALSPALLIAALAAIAVARRVRTT